MRKQSKHMFWTLTCIMFMTFLALAGKNDFTFSSPEEGSIWEVGKTIRIEFEAIDSTISLGREMVGFSNDNGMTWSFLPLFLNGDDTVSILKHYDWEIPVSFVSSRNSDLEVITESDSCRVCIAYYETKRSRGSSEVFIIRAATPITRDRSPLIRSSESTGSQWIAASNITPLSHFVRSAHTDATVIFSVDGRIRYGVQSKQNGKKSSSVVIVKKLSADLLN